MAISLVDFQNQTTDPKRKGIVQKITNDSVFLKRLRFIPVDGFTYEYRRQDTLGGVAFRGLNANYSPDQGVVNPYIESLAIFGGEVRTDRQIVNKQGDVVRANQIAAKVKKAGLFYDRYVIKGDPAADALQFYGLNARLTGNQVIAAGTNGGTLTLDMVDAALDAVVGTTGQKILVMNKVMRRKMSKLATGLAGGAAVFDVGRQLTEYQGATIEVLDEDGDEQPILDFTEVQGSSGAACTSIYAIRLGSDTDGEFVQGLIGGSGSVPNIEHVQVGLLGTYFSDIIEANIGLAVFHGRSACRIKGITNT